MIVMIMTKRAQRDRRVRVYMGNKVGSKWEKVHCLTNRGWALDRSANSRQPPDRLQYVFFSFCDPVTLTFDLSTPKLHHL